MKDRTRWMAIGCVWLLAAAAVSAEENVAAGAAGPVLWQMGRADNDTRDFALAPDGYARFSDDPVYVVGVSDAAKDWPYAQPGPSDAWAGSRRHTFTIAFGLKVAPKDGPCRLLVDLVDTQGKTPPTLRVAVNGHASDHPMPQGAGDASISGDPSKGREHRLEVAVPAGHLRDGLNEVALTTLSGSWVLYDWVGFEAPAGTALSAPTGTVVRSIRSEPVLVEREGKLRQVVQVSLLHMGPEADAEVQVGSAKPMACRLKAGANVVDGPVDAVEAETNVPVTVRECGDTILFLPSVPCPERISDEQKRQTRNSIVSPKYNPPLGLSLQPLKVGDVRCSAAPWAVRRSEHRGPQR